jgi:hypothetical protein
MISEDEIKMFEKLAGAEGRNYLWGWYSAEAKSKGMGGVIYTDLSGEEVLVTNVGYDPFARDYHWSDKVLVGPVLDFVRPCKPTYNRKSYCDGHDD